MIDDEGRFESAFEFLSGETGAKAAFALASAEEKHIASGWAS